MTKTMRIICFGALIALLAGCSAPPTSPPPTLDLQPTFNAVREQAVGTVFAALTQNAPPTPLAAPTTAPPQPKPTRAPEPTTAPLDTPTPLPSPTATLFFPTFTSTPADWNCTVLDFSPERFATISPNANFNGIWLIKNTGKQTWYYSDIDILYASGTRFQRFYDGFDLERDVTSGETYTITVEMRAPADLGTYSTTWVVSRGSQVVCPLLLTIIVK